jgi:hypothetical protein
MKPTWNSNGISAKILLICRQCGVSHSIKGKYATSTIEVDSETLNEIDTISLVKECPDCWDPMLRKDRS